MANNLQRPTTQTNLKALALELIQTQEFNSSNNFTQLIYKSYLLVQCNLNPTKTIQVFTKHLSYQKLLQNWEPPY